MRRPSAYAVALLAAAAIAGCGSSSGGSSSSQSATPSATTAKPEQFPSAKGLSLADLRQRYPSVAQLAPGAGVLSKGPTRMPFLVLDKGGKPVLGASVALYTLRPDGSGLRGPFPATSRTFGLNPAFISQTAQSDLQITKGFYTADPVLRSTKPANMIALLRLDGRLVSTGPAPLGAKFSKTPVQVGQMAPRVHTQTITDVGGNAKAIDTRVPPALDMLKDDLYDVLGKKPVVLVFATPQLCQSRVCGPVVDVAEQVKSETKADVAFIHNEVYVDNNPNKGLRPQLTAYGLQTEPWIFVIDRTGKVVQRFEGAVSVDELKAAVAKVSSGSGYASGMSTEPETLTLAQAARRAVDVVDHEAADDALSSFLARFEDRDEPVTAVEQPDELFAEAAGSIDPDDPALHMAAAVASYLSFKRDQVGAQPDDLLRRAAEAEYDGHPPEAVQAWLSQRL